MEKTNGAVKEYSREWYNKMVAIWKDRIDLMGCIRTGALRNSVTNGSLSVNDYDINATFRFLTYGIYVDAGVGNGYKKGNGGNLQILNKDYRQQHGMKKQRTRRPWYSASWAISRRVLNNKLAELIGEEFLGSVTELKETAT